MSDLYDTLRDEFYALRGQLQARLADGPDIGDVLPLIRDFAHSSVIIAEKLDVPGPQKKALVAEAIVRWWKEAIRPALEQRFDLPGPDAFYYGAFESLLPQFVDFIIDWLVKDLNVVGWPKAN